ncbi:MAG: hypothetical protein K0R19_455 [Bacillota bacterium]|jgi:hypothetical protein|nr:hypothetical protein [Bacillota bacterium]
MNILADALLKVSDIAAKRPKHSRIKQVENRLLPVFFHLSTF